jgi:bifunctional non-homologous end joining protein LigD
MARSTKSEQALAEYRSKRDFKKSPEPSGKTGGRARGNGYLIQKHDASRLHYDLRLELDGVLKSWAVTKGPSLNPSDKRLAVRVEDHPLDYGDFEGVIPEGYGAGTVMLWDEGTWEPQDDPHEGLENGMLKFVLHGERLQGGFALVRMRPRGKEKRENWLLVKERDEFADEGLDPRAKYTDSIRSGRDLEAIASKGESLDHFNERHAEDGEEAQKPAKRPASHKSAAPAFVKPQLATLRDAPPDGDGWLHELKFDGYRIQALKSKGKVTLYTRNGENWTERYPTIAEAVSKLKVDEVTLDGELVAIDANGRSDFGTLQNAASNDDILLRYYAFDLLNLDGEDLRPKPLTERKSRLEKLLKRVGDPLHYSDHIAGRGERVIEKACAMHLEGIVSKKADAPYRSGRGLSWIKSKCIGNDEFVIAGYRRSDKRGRPFSSLLLGEYDGDRLLYRGRVGTGFDESTLKDLSAKMRPLERKSSPLDEPPQEARNRAVWVTPRLVAQVSYTERTADGRLRHPSYLGLREDKPAEEIQMAPAAENGRQSAEGGNSEPVEIAGVRVTHPDRVLFPEQGATKRNLAEYYVEHSDQILRFLADRPLTLVRCPEGRGGQCFFQKHHTKGMPKALKTIEISEKEGEKAPYLLANSQAALVATAQIGALELHIWGSRADRLEQPERIVFDLDPDTGLSFDDVRAAAYEMREMLEAADLESFPLLTGGKGIHVIAPLTRRQDWEEVKQFARGLAEAMAGAAPERYVATASKAKRRGKIFIDYLRNERGSTAIAPFSPRAREGAPVATPVSWKELSSVRSADTYTLGNIRQRLAQLKEDPWAGYESVRQSLKARVMARFAGKGKTR